MVATEGKGRGGAAAAKRETPEAKAMSMSMSMASGIRKGRIEGSGQRRPAGPAPGPGQGQNYGEASVVRWLHVCGTGNGRRKTRARRRVSVRSRCICLPSCWQTRWDAALQDQRRSSLISLVVPGVPCCQVLQRLLVRGLSFSLSIACAGCKSAQKAQRASHGGLGSSTPRSGSSNCGSWRASGLAGTQAHPCKCPVPSGVIFAVRL